MSANIKMIVFMMMNGPSLSGGLGLVGWDGVGAIPNGGISVSAGGDHDGSHDGGNVKSRPLRHENIE